MTRFPATDLAVTLSFIGASGHITNGGVNLSKNADGTVPGMFDKSFALHGPRTLMLALAMLLAA